ncbi:lipocalin family protein [Acetobacteraceae bacterium H6797]|nr:lipocalin family protein [Acetobacteraceae bacterium H6797]
MSAIRRWSLSMLCAAGLAACGPVDHGIPLAQNVDLQRYSGRWYVIANIPYFAERGKVGSYFEISVEGDKFSDVYWGRKSFSEEPGSFTMKGYVVPGTGNAYWRESPLWPIYLSYLIVYVDQDYRHALVGYPGRGYGWVLARDPVIEDAKYRELLSRFAAAGYDTSQFRRVPQRPEDIGKPDYQ